MTTTAALERYEAVIGIEVHCQLRTASKMFCGCSTDYDGAPPNSHVCPVCLGLPGALPIINRRAVEHVLATGAAIEATAPTATRWDRKNYFYPDLPKGYQISQYDLPLASLGRLTFDTSDGPFTVAITRAHLEEDTAKLVHATDDDGRKVSLVDFNRSGAPLMEIVTEPDIRTAEQARRYAEELQLAAALDRGVGRGHGARPDARRGERLASAARYGAVRHADRGQEHELVPGRGAGDRVRDRAPGGRPRRGRAAAPGDPRLVGGARRDVPDAGQGDVGRLPLLPGAGPAAAPSRRRLAGRRAGRAAGAARRRAGRATATSRACRPTTRRSSSPIRTRRPCSRRRWRPVPALEPKPVANWVTGEYLRLRNAVGRAGRRVRRRARGDHRVGRGRIDHAGPGSRGPRGACVDRAMPPRRSSRRAASARSPTAAPLGAAVDDVLAANPAAVADYRAGKAQAVGFLVGQVMKATRGQANAALVQAAVRERLESDREGEG